MDDSKKEFSELKKLIASNHLDKALDILEKMTNEVNPKYEAQVLLTKNRFNELNTNLRKKVISVEQAQIERNNIVLGIIELFGEIEKSEIKEIKDSIDEVKEINKNQKKKFIIISFLGFISTVFLTVVFFQIRPLLLIQTVFNSKTPVVLNDKKLKGIIDVLADDLKIEYLKIGRELKDVWGLSQTINSLYIYDPGYNLDHTSYIDFVYEDYNSEINSWKFILTDNVKYHVGVHAWTVLTLSNIQAEVDTMMVKFLLDKQDMRGFWTLYPTIQSNKASMYATCYSLLALKSALLNQRISSVYGSRIDYAIKLGSLWIKKMKNEFPNDIGWSDYPLDKEFGHYSRAISSLVIYTLNAIVEDQGQIDHLNKEYIRTMPYKLVTATYMENTNVEIKVSEEKTTFDSTRNLLVPWELYAICAVYQYGSLVERYKCNKWINSILNEVRPGYTQIHYWMKAELLMAFLHLQNASEN